MKTEISRDSHQPNKRYSGVYQQQGRMLSDADWNELVEILKQRLNESLKDIVGSKESSLGGTPRHRALKIIDKDGIKIQPGHVYINGVAAEFPGDADTPYDEQPDFPAPPELFPGDYVLYADVWERTVTHFMDEHLRDKGLHGADTCTRKQTMVQIKNCANRIDPEQAEQNPNKGDAELTVTLHPKTTQPNLCDPCVSQLDIESRVGNYLFRVEVHDVDGVANKPKHITLKWSAENAAEQFQGMATKKEMPVGFIGNKYVYEFFSETSEKHLGVHLVTESGFPVRDVLHKEYPETAPSGFDFVRRWDGYAKFKWSDLDLKWQLDEGVSEGRVLVEADTSTDDEKILQLDSIELKQQLLNRIISEPVTSDMLVAGSLIINEIINVDSSINSSAKEKATAINTASALVAASESVSARAITVLQGIAPTETGVIEPGQLKIDGKDVVLTSVADNINAQTDALVDAIHTLFSADTDLVVSKSPSGLVVLTANDGRDISVEVSSNDVSKRCGFITDTHRGRITIFSSSNSAISITGNNPEYAGFKLGTTPPVQFVAGDYWLAEIREAEHKAGSVLIKNQQPEGIEHQYLTLGEVDIAGQLLPNPEADRKYSFPPLTEMTRMFHVGGDGQEAMPGHILSQSLKVGVANGEWPVAGVKIEFTVTEGNGELIPHPEFPLEHFDAGNPITGIAATDGGDFHGLVHCGWKLGPGGDDEEDRRQCVTVQLVAHDSNPGDPGYPQYHVHPPIHFYANLSTADHVAYENPTCEDSPPVTVNYLLNKDSVDNGVFTWPDLDDDAEVTVKDVLDAFLCKLQAKHVPYNPLIKEERWKDVNEEEEEVGSRLPVTVQDAIDNLVDNLHSEDIIYTPNCISETDPTVRSKLDIPDDKSSRVHEILDKLLCDFNATHLPIDKADGDLCARLKVDEVETVQDALATLCGDGDTKWHNKHLHGWGVVCGLKVKCHSDREKIEVAPGYALDCDGADLNFIKGDENRIYDLINKAQSNGLLDEDGNGEVCLWIDLNAEGQVQINIERHIPESFFDSVLEGSLIKDFFDDCILGFFSFLMDKFPGSLDDEVPLTEEHHRATALINIIAQSINSDSGQYVFISHEEDRLLREFHELLKEYLESETFCAMFDNDAAYPDYDFDAGLETIFGPPFKLQTRLRLHPSGKLAYSYGSNNKVYVYDLTVNEYVKTLVFPASDNIDIKDIVFTADGLMLYAIASFNDGNTTFASATIDGAYEHSWSPATVINGIELVSLALSPAFVKNVYAIGKSEGLFIIDPNDIALTPGAADVPFNATGLLTLSTDGTRAFATFNNSMTTETTSFTHVRNIDLNNIDAVEVLYRINGKEGENDFKFYNNIIYLTGYIGVNPDDDVLVGYDINTGNPAFEPVTLEDSSISRLEILGSAEPGSGTHRIDAEGSAIGAVEAAATKIPASSVAAGTITIKGSRDAGKIIFAANDSARTIANSINKAVEKTGVSAKAVTWVRLSDLSKAGKIVFELAAEGAKAVEITAHIINLNDLALLVTAINAQSSITNVTAVSRGDTLNLFNNNGDDITIENFRVAGSTSQESITVSALRFDGKAFRDSKGKTTRLIEGSTHATRITGQLRLESSSAFSISEGGESVLPAGDSIAIGTANPEEYLLVALADKYKLMRFNIATKTLDTNFRIPAQNFPIDMVVSANRSKIYVQNMISNTLTLIDIPVVFDPSAPPNFTEEPPTISNVLSIYNQDANDAYSDLFSHLLEHFKECF